MPSAASGCRRSSRTYGAAALDPWIVARDYAHTLLQPMTPLLHDPLAHWLVVAATVAVVVAIIATRSTPARKRQLSAASRTRCCVPSRREAPAERADRRTQRLPRRRGCPRDRTDARARLTPQLYIVVGSSLPSLDPRLGDPQSRPLLPPLVTIGQQRIVRRGPYRVLRHLVLHRTRVRLRGLRADVRELGECCRRAARHGRRDVAAHPGRGPRARHSVRRRVRGLCRARRRACSLTFGSARKGAEPIPGATLREAALADRRGAPT